MSIRDQSVCRPTMHLRFFIRSHLGGRYINIIYARWCPAWTFDKYDPILKQWVQENVFVGVWGPTAHRTDFAGHYRCKTLECPCYQCTYKRDDGAWPQACQTCSHIPDPRCTDIPMEGDKCSCGMVGEGL